MYHRLMQLYSNTVTGENRPSYKITPIERNVTARPNTDISSPLTGEGSRGSTYSISVEERRRKPVNANNSRNVLTGENCNTYQICQEMRSERKSSAPPAPRGSDDAKIHINTEHRLVQCNAGYGF
ncbi:unnamed protein product [Taenia asiatica]|uniref:Uncharacterized protein n=1 Tax=Taenia asiatica TaxID=60517 RepID=A0A0R3WGE5_TAEAS|nr:unnamed protein product [Taenia asiatica]